MERVNFKAQGLFLPLLADELIRGQASQGFELFGEIVSHQEGLQVFFELLMRLVVEALHGSIFDGSVHAFYLLVGPRVSGPSASVLDGVLLTGPGEGVHTEQQWRCSIFLFRLDLFFYPSRLGRGVGKVCSAVRKHSVDGVGDSGDQGAQKIGSASGGFGMQLREGELAGAIDGHEQIVG
jgi:hypothetical protein